VPFTEDFAVDAADWFNSAGTAEVSWSAAGGPDGGSYVSTTFNFVASSAIDTPALFRAQDEFGSSGGAFVGNWVTDGVAAIRGFVRHNTGVPTTFFVRYASPVNFPGAATLVTPAVPSGQWTEFVIFLPNPNIVFEGPFTYPQVFGNIGHVQIGVAVPASLVGVNQVFTFDLDKVALLNANGIPAASTWSVITFVSLLMIAGAVVMHRRLGALPIGASPSLANSKLVVVLGLLVLAMSGSGASATFVPFTEDFNSSSSNWYNRANTAPSTWISSGGPDGGAYVTADLNFLEFFSAGQAPALFRAHDELNSSGGAFVGDWIVEGIDQFGYWIRHDAGVPLQFFARFAVTNNHPAGSSVSAPIPANVWTQISFPVPDPEMQFEGKFGFETVFHGVAHIQTGLLVPASLVGVDQTFTFDMDKVNITPEPATLGMLALAGSIAGWESRRRKVG
jgi:hypothetical protein